MPRVRRIVRRARRPGLLSIGIVAALVVTLWTPTVASADPAPVKPSDAQIAAAEAQRRADIASLGRLTGQIAALDGEIERQRVALESAVKRYNETSAALQLAVIATNARTKDVLAARVSLDKARRAAQAQARKSYMNRAAGGSSLIIADDPNRAVAASDYHRFVVTRQRNAVGDLALARVKSSNAQADARVAEERSRVLQQDAVDQRDKVISGLRAFQGRKLELGAQRVKLNRQAAVAFGRLNKLLTQKAAYAAWDKRQRELQAAEAARQAALRRQQQQSGGAGGTSVAAPVLAPASGGTWGNPMAAGTYEISSCFCARWGTFHYGVDFAAALGTPMYSVGAGTVVAAGPAQGFGNWVVINHGTGEFSVYGHMRVLAVSVGQPVARGQLIAYVGTEGDSTGPHLHLEIRLGGIDGTRIDPQVWLAQRGVYV